MPPQIGLDRQVNSRRLLAAGLTAAALAGLAGGAFELWRFGRSDTTAAARVEAHIRREFGAMTAALSDVAERIATDPIAVQGLSDQTDGARTLFDLVERVRTQAAAGQDVSVTVYDMQAVEAVARAWVGRPTDVAADADRLSGPPAFFVAQSAVGLRLVHVQGVQGEDGRRLGAVAAEHVLSPGAPATTITASDHYLTTPQARVSLRMRYEGAGDRMREGSFLLRAPSGDPLVEAVVSPRDLQASRARHRRRTVAVVLAAAGFTMLLLMGPPLDRRPRARDEAAYLWCTVEAALLLLGGTSVIWLGLAWMAGGPPGSAATLLLAGFAGAALAATAAGPVVRLRLRYRPVRRAPAHARVAFVATQLLAGSGSAILIVLFARLLDVAVDPLSVDLRHFSLHPWSGTRLLLLGGILALHVAVLWTAALLLAAAPSRWRLPRRARGSQILLLALWLLPAAAAAALIAWWGWAVPVAGTLASGAACAVAALVGHRVAAWYRHATVAARIFTLFLAFLLPALLLYPSVDFFARRATERLITTRFAVEAQNHPQALIDRLAEARDEIDALTFLPDLVGGAASPLAPGTESAFLVWNQTVLARARLTSSVELYDRTGGLISRFALNLPEYTGIAQQREVTPGCGWDVYGEGAPFGSEERRLLRAERNICVPADDVARSHVAGTIVLRVAFDYRTLPFITSQSPYFELFRPAETGTPGEGTPGGDVDVTIYGWGLRPIYTSGRAAWPIAGGLFDRIYSSREAFWTTIPRARDTYRVHISNDRAGIYAIGYPVLTLFDHLVHLAELATLGGVAFVMVLLGTALFTRVSRERPSVGRALLREIRASFYRKLFLAFVLASIVPVITLALVIRAFFADRLRNDVLAEAARTAAVAQRVIEGSDALLRRGAGGVASVSDDVMIWISQVVDQDVNIFDGPRLVATSERDLFSSGLLPTRTPDDIYRAIALERRASFVDEDEIGTFSYMIAAAPVHAGGRDAILTVPLTLRQREIEREIDELDRGVHLAALFFILLGAAIGLSLAERIADPVRRLTRATRRIAGGDFDARIAVRSSDELRRLVDAFNSMAGELKAQRAQLERTHRLEAWADMARQVAHEIKNPLTPIQLSTEHLQRVHADRGEPMGAVFDNCVAAILGQVRLLRQIAAEFSSFAASPTASRTPVDLVDVVAEVTDPYRSGLSGRIEIHNRVVGPLPPVLIDRTLIARALVNIVENAVHAMPGAGSLTIDATADGEYVALSLRDTGIGMDDRSLAHVFEPYFSTKATGTGLGLPIARRNVELSGGTIEVQSARGRGTTVIVKLPVASDVVSSQS
ncbi:MAG TPA: HAMP domain-containing sensor histidine kinase [Vicinamibacterales bacterium]|nr:HAMP domain-containing sensor histidine kinase [Vicinamibacterales bacterium]